MHLREDQTHNIHKLVSELFSSPLNTSSLARLYPLIGRITDSQYFALVLFPGPNIFEPIYLSNNPDDFNSIYLEIQDKDFLLQELFNSARPVLYNRLLMQDIPEKEEFLTDLNKVRPVSDCCYVPIKFEGRIFGFIGIAREGASNLPFNANEVGIIHFTCSFLIESLGRSLAVPEQEGNEGVLNRKGEVIEAGDSMEEVLKGLFGECWKTPLWSFTPHTARFSEQWRSFTSPLILPGSSRFTFELRGELFYLEFSSLKAPFLSELEMDSPCVKITLKPGNRLVPAYRDSEYSFTRREEEIIDCIFRGLTNPEISTELCISVSTVKKHIWNIFNKVGIDNRMGLVLSLSS